MVEGITISFRDGDAIVRELQGFSKITAAQAQSKLEKAGHAMDTGINNDTPVLTGYLKSRNTLAIGPGLVTESNDADYALFVILGHHTRSGSFVPPNDFMTPSWHAAGQQLVSDLKGLVP